MWQSNTGRNGQWVFKLSGENDTPCFLDVAGYDLVYSSQDSNHYSPGNSYNPSYSHNSYQYATTTSSPWNSWQESDQFDPSYNSYSFSSLWSPSYCSYCSYDYSFPYVSIPCKNHQPAISQFYSYGPEFGDSEICKYQTIGSVNIFLHQDIPFGTGRYSTVHVSKPALIFTI